MGVDHAPSANEKKLRALLGVGRSLVADLDLESVLHRVLAAARELTGARYAALGVLDETGHELERFLTEGIDHEARRAIGPLPRGHGVLGVLIRDPRPLRLADVGEHPRSYGFPRGHPPMRTFLGVPIRVRDAVYGNLYLTEKAAGPFTDDDQEMLVVLAEWAGIAIDNARAYSLLRERQEELERALAESTATGEIAEALAGETDLEHVLELVVKRARALSDARATLLMLPDGDTLVVVASAGDLDRRRMPEPIPVEGSVGGGVLRSGRPERLPDATGRLRFELADWTRAEAGLFVPLRLRGRVLGVLCAFDRLRDGPQFSARDERMLDAFASSAAAAVATAQDVSAQFLEQSVAAAEHERARWARELHDETLQELAAVKVLLMSVRLTTDQAERERHLDVARERIGVAVQALRDLIADLRPATLAENGLRAALEALVERVARTGDVAVALRVELDEGDGAGPRRLGARLEDTIYRLVQEALSNVVKHASATRVGVVVRDVGDAVEVVVDDDGEGFDPGADVQGFGLAGMRERAVFVDGSVRIDSVRGRGTSVHASFPREESDAVARVLRRRGHRRPHPAGPPGTTPVHRSSAADPDEGRRPA